MPLHPLTTQILKNYYPYVAMLNSFISDISPTTLLILPADPPSYISLLNTSIVARTDIKDDILFTFEKPNCSQRELIDRVHAYLFAKDGPRNVLTLGYRMGDARDEFGRTNVLGGAVSNFFVNTTISDLQSEDWQLLLERIGESAMFHLLSSTSIFVALPNECLCQVSGPLITDLKPSTTFLDFSVKRTVATMKRTSQTPNEPPSKRRRLDNKPSCIIPQKTIVRKTKPVDVALVRTRMFYARPSIDRRTGRISVGFPSRHILSHANHSMIGRVPESHQVEQEAVLMDIIHMAEESSSAQARHLLKHIFPLQHRLRSVFTTEPVTGRSLRFDDYIVRENEIQLQVRRRTPSRLQSIIPLAQQLLLRHRKCNYRAIRGRFCPSKIKQNCVAADDSTAILEMVSEGLVLKTQVSDLRATFDAQNTPGAAERTTSTAKANSARPRFADFSCSYQEVFNFVRAVILLVVPRALWGCTMNLKSILNCIQAVIIKRRFETITLHTILQGLSTSECSWLYPASSKSHSQRANAAEAHKRRELLAEFIYWIFDSFVISLLKTNFYITESSVYRNRVLYFRQDDWNTLCAPLLDRLATSTFQRLTNDEARFIMHERQLGASFVRFLPKETGIRPVVNLSYQDFKRPNGTTPQSINQILRSAFQILTLEKDRQPALIGASAFGLNDIYWKLKEFRSGLASHSIPLQKFYFVKVDVKACFDTIAQEKLLEIVNAIVSDDGYMIQKFGQISPTAGKSRKIVRRLACADGEHPHFLALAADLAAVLRHGIFVDHVVYSYEDRQKLISLLREHIVDNIVKIGDDYYRQYVGIPQGSVLSTLLCSFFYGDLERNQLAFTRASGNLLLRYVDDYCFITTNKHDAVRFLEIMNAGHPEYGAFVVQEKTLTNFDYHANLMNRTASGQRVFPWCGLLIDMNNLSVSVDYGCYQGNYLANFLTVDARCKPGKAFLHKMLRMGKHRIHVLYCDTDLSTATTVYLNFYQNYILSAMKMRLYLKDLPGELRNGRFIYYAISQTIKFSVASMRSMSLHSLAKRYGASCAISRSAITWLGWHAFASVMEKKHASYDVALSLVRAQRDARRYRMLETRFKHVIEKAWQSFVDVIY